MKLAFSLALICFLTIATVLVMEFTTQHYGAHHGTPGEASR